MKYSKGKITLDKGVTSKKKVQKIELYPTPEKVSPLKKRVKDKFDSHRGRLLRGEDINKGDMPSLRYL